MRLMISKECIVNECEECGSRFVLMNVTGWKATQQKIYNGYCPYCGEKWEKTN